MNSPIGPVALTCFVKLMKLVDAAIWLSDMRGFTVFTDSLPPRVLIDLLNRYFDCQVPVILDYGAKP